LQQGPGQKSSRRGLLRQALGGRYRCLPDIHTAADQLDDLTDVLARSDGPLSLSARLARVWLCIAHQAMGGAAASRWRSVSARACAAPFLASIALNNVLPFARRRRNPRTRLSFGAWREPNHGNGDLDRGAAGGLTDRFAVPRDRPEARGCARTALRLRETLATGAAVGGLALVALSGSAARSPLCLRASRRVTEGSHRESRTACAWCASCFEQWPLCRASGSC